MIRRIVILGLTGLILLSISACIGDGELKIRNRSTTDVSITLDYYDQRTVRPNEDYSRFYNTDTNVTVQYDGLYLFSGSTTRYIERGNISVITLSSDGGAIRVINNSNRTISKVYLSPSQDETWGSDDLFGDIAPGASVSWTVDQGFWDIKIVNNADQEYSFFNKQILMDSTYTQFFEGRGERGDKSSQTAGSVSDMRSEQRHQ